MDINVGRLAKWLRVMGYDATFPRERGDNELVCIALLEDRVLVTRDSGIAQRRAVRLGQMKVVRIEKDDLPSQLKQLVTELKLDLAGGFSRCVCCNQMLHPRLKQDLAQRLPPYVFQTHSQFMECPQCHRLYWRGTHWNNMVSELESLHQEES